MNTITENNISALNKILEDTIIESNELYKKLGNKILQEAASPESAQNFPSPDEIISWSRLHDERTFCSESILDIKNNTARLEELQKFKTQIEKSKSDLKKEIENYRGTILVYLADNFFCECTHLFENIGKEFSSIQEAVLNCQNDIADFTEQKSSANFVKKILLTNNISAVQKKIKKLQAEKKELLLKNANAIIDSDEVKKLYQEKSMSPSIAEEYEQILKLTVSLSDSEQRLQTIIDEYNSINKKLSELNADKKSSKQIAYFNTRIKEIDTKINTITKKIGDEYVNQFFSKTGQLLVSENEYDNLQSPHIELLTNLGNTRREIVKLNYKIELCNVTQKIKSEETKIADLTAYIKKSENEIEHLKTKIAETEADIAKTKNNVVNLKEQSEKLETNIADINPYIKK